VAGEELNINYDVDNCGFPGMPWAVRSVRQQKLLKGYRFECGCVLCSGQLSTTVESALCGACGAEARTGPTGVRCIECAAEWAHEEVPGKTAGDKVVLSLLCTSRHDCAQVARLSSMWQKGGEAVALQLCKGLEGLLTKWRTVLHPEHVSLYQVRQW